jgi:endo-1,4-beta-xylanase
LRARRSGFRRLQREGAGSTSFCLQPNGRYISQWSNVGSWVGGIGWQIGGRRTVTYSAILNSSGNSYVALYGWTKDPVIEYYIVDSWDTYRPPAGQGFVGTVTSTGVSGSRSAQAAP